MAFIRKVKTKSGATAVQVAHKAYGRIIRVDHIGSAHDQAELETLLILAQQRLRGNQRSLFDLPSTRDLSISLQCSVSKILLDVLLEQYQRLGFQALGDQDFAYLCLARLVEPTSKLDSLRVLADLGVNGLDKNRLYRCLKRVITNRYRDKLSHLCFERASRVGLSLVLYDVTTLYFEIQEEDDYRKAGLSKERRLEPQIVVGLLVDRSGFPLALQSFEGNRAEVKTILPVLEDFKACHTLTEVTVVADAAMLSRTNLDALAAAGYHYIVGSRLAKIPYAIAEYQETQDLTDNQIITAQTATPGQRIIYQYRSQRAALDQRNIDRQITKAERIVKGQAPVSRVKFLTVKAKEHQLNDDLIKKTRALAGIKGYVTNLAIPDEQVIISYHQLWQVEQSFRMSKSDLKARPIFHRKREAIEAHLTVVMAALAIGRTIEQQTGVSLKQVVKTLQPVRSGIVLIHGKAYSAEAVIPPSVAILLKKLRMWDTN